MREGNESIEAQKEMRALGKHLAIIAIISPEKSSKIPHPRKDLFMKGGKIRSLPLSLLLLLLLRLITTAASNTTAVLS